ncbi:hypothetical protein Pelo_19937 [Pelomyxa schiedti]|nr:hypothetical protein Pelo_19937 [Pelomyxa schiedti]
MALLNTKSSRPANKTTGAVVNIPMSVGDSFYRYQRPDLSIKVVGIRGGARTVLSNIVKVAEALYCPASYPTKDPKQEG